MNLKNKSVLVTGGAGFIGSHLVDRLVKEKPSNIIVVDNFYLGKESNLRDARLNFPSLKIVKMDCSDQKKMERLVKNEDVDVVFNLAVIPLPISLIEPCWVYRHNVDMALSACELARKGFYKTLVHFSSSEAYGDCQYAPMDEGHPLNPTTSYGASKAACDHLILSYCKSFRIDAVIIRPFNNYGPRQNEGSYAGVIPVTIKRILGGDSPIVHGDGEQTRDFIYVADTAEAAIKAYNCLKTRGKILNIARSKEISINSLVALITEHLQCSKPVIHDEERPGDLRRLVGSTVLAKELIGFEPITSWQDGLKSTIQWFKKARHNVSVKK